MRSKESKKGPKENNTKKSKNYNKNNQCIKLKVKCLRRFPESKVSEKKINNIIRENSKKTKYLFENTKKNQSI